jgi:serine/threonine protein kinase/formylglycine-generating enzyme required for sulfatase activity/dienelactone hydrolase
VTGPRQSAEELFGEALELPPDGRSAFLDRVCAHDLELRRQIEYLLLQDERASSFLAAPLLEHNQGAVTGYQAAASGPPNAGTRFGRYVIIEPLGAGGMGVVYRARDEKLDRIVAIKLLAPGVFNGEDARGRFRREALALAKLSHAHIAAIYDVGEQDNVDYIVMECIAGESLAAKLKAGPLSVKEATSMLLQIAQAVEDAHEQGIIHRDLKPANVMISGKGQAKVLDFGLAKLLAAAAHDAAETIRPTRGIVGTPQYMSPEQAEGQSVDTRTDLWNLGVLYYEMLTGRAPFQAESSLAVLRAIADRAPTPMNQLRPDVPPAAEKIVARALKKDPGERYQTAAEVVRDSFDLLAGLGHPSLDLAVPAQPAARRLYVTVIATILLIVATASWLYHRASRRSWAKEEAIPQIKQLLYANTPLAAFDVLAKAREYLPDNPELRQLVEQNSEQVSITSSPAGATIEIQDYRASQSPWHSLGSTPLANVVLPKGHFRWKIVKEGAGELVVAPETGAHMYFALDALQKAPPGMVALPGGTYVAYIGFIGFYGPYKLPPFYLDRYEVTNGEYQKFVDSGGYEKQEYWQEPIARDGREISWKDAMAQFRDLSDRAGPATWSAGHYPAGQDNLPVQGVSWFEAAAYANFAGKQLPVIAQWYQAEPVSVAADITEASNIDDTAVAPVGKFQGLGPYGTFDMVGNVREWVFNASDHGTRFILGGSWSSQSYMSVTPEALSPFDRSAANGIRCVRNTTPVPAPALAPVKSMTRDFAGHKPASDDVFRAYEALYAYPVTPLQARVEGVVEDTADWREEKVSFDAAYDGERMAVYLFLPKNVRPPYQTVLFFPSARVEGLRDSRQLGDLKFFDYIIQSGRAVAYPVYDGTYERKLTYEVPRGLMSNELNVAHYKDAARTLDYLATRKDIDSDRLAYLGVSMGSAKGVVLATLLQPRIKTAIFLDGGYFLFPPLPGSDQADFAPRLKIPVLMVNGRYDYSFSLRESQNPMFAALGSPAADKEHLVLDTPHDVTERRPQLVKAVLDWLNRYLGRVS